ncbi:hypothetical protein Cgig2_000276 [Carnegiea gigantea]|uniref:Uncharacterized protein n=1 Tax=Carnegiea gigantea TaxID=171969 RepID=A0A9Q1Q747_9CARY|nr:hypothetical protein Cgig2_000276 [Carnegiea gigantea]
MDHENKRTLKQNSVSKIQLVQQFQSFPSQTFTGNTSDEKGVRSFSRFAASRYHISQEVNGTSSVLSLAESQDDRVIGWRPFPRISSKSFIASSVFPAFKNPSITMLDTTVINHSFKELKPFIKLPSPNQTTKVIIALDFIIAGMKKAQRWATTTIGAPIMVRSPAIDCTRFTLGNSTNPILPLFPIITFLLQFN